MSSALQFRTLAKLICALSLGATVSCSPPVEDAPIAPVPSSLQVQPAPPSTVAEAARVLDLATLPLIAGAELPGRRSLAGLSYRAPGTVKEAYEFHRKQLADLKWQAAEGGYVTEQSASGTFTRDGYKLSLTVSPTGNGRDVNVTLLQLGNVDLALLPLPVGTTPLYSGPTSAMAVATTSVEETAEACRKLLLAKGWQPYGSAGDTYFFKQNAMHLSAMISAAPAQGGKTVISYSAELMSADLPAPADAIALQYSDVNTQLGFDTTGKPEDVTGFYRSELAKAGWEATTEKLIKVGDHDTMIFRNPRKDMLTLEMHTVDDKLRVLLEHQTAAEVDELERLAKAEIARRQAEKDTPRPKLTVVPPAEAKDGKRTKSLIEFHVASGKAKAIVEAWRKQFTADGWKEEVTALDSMAGTMKLSKESQRLTITYIDAGVLSATVTLVAFGVELELPAEKN